MGDVISQPGLGEHSPRREPALPDRSPKALWETALGQLELQVTRPNFETWLRETVGLRIEHQRFVVGAPSDFAVVWLESRLNPLINRTVSQLLGDSISVSFEVLGSQPIAPTSSDSLTAQSLAGPPPPDLNPRLTFAAFAVIESNRLAYHAARRVAAGEKNGYNPLILCGPPGLGKTHLLHAIAHEVASSGKHVVLLTCKEFAERYAKTVRDGHRHEFLDTYRHIDILLLDDLQFLTTRPGSQEQFFHIFDALYSTDRLLVLTSDAPPQALDGLSLHLSSRLQAGLTVTVQLPPQEERFEILLTKVADLKNAPPEEILQLISRQRCQHIRELEGALNRVVAYAELTGNPYTIELAKQALHPLHEPLSRPAPDAILKAVCKHFHLPLNQITGPSRARDITYARHIAMYLLRYSSQRPLAEIGKLLGNRDHTTVLSGCQRIKRELTSLPQTHTDIQQLEAAL